MSKDYYNILGVDKNADEKQIKSAYRKLSLKNHPDRNPGDKEAEERFKEIAEAYRVLSDKDLRKRYDTYGTVDGVNGMEMNADDIFAQFMRMHNGFGFGFDEEQEKVFVGMNKTIKVNVTIADIFKHAKKEITYTVKRKCKKCNGSGSKNGKIENCSHCNGTGQIHTRQQFGHIFTENISTCPYCNGKGKLIKDKCPTCNGTGLVDTKETITIEVPNIYDIVNKSFVNKGLGHSCENDMGENGNLIIKFNIVNDEEYSLNPQNLLDVVKIIKVPVIDCLLGGTLSYEYLDGKTYNIKLDECTPNGKIYRVSGKGFNIGQYTGDLYVKIELSLPKSLTKEDKELLNKLKENETFKK